MRQGQGWAVLAAAVVAACGGGQGSSTQVGANGMATPTQALALGSSTAAAAPGLLAGFSTGLASLTGTATGATAVAAAQCGAGSLPETGAQGQVPLADRQSGRSQQGYRCNLELVGQYQGEGASWVNPFHDHCAYMATSFGGIALKRSQGVQVVDASDPAHPRLTANLTSPAMFQGPWESLKVNAARGLMGGVAVGPVVSAGFFDVYDVATDCAHPKLLNSFNGNATLPANVLGHEGQWSPDGNTYWATGFAGGAITAIDVSQPAHPRIVYTSTTVLPNHGFTLSDDGNRMYLTTAFPAGVLILDTSDVQKRLPVPMVRNLGSVLWNAAGVAQHTIPVRYGAHPYLMVVDEFASEGARIIDIADETRPVVVNHLQLAIQLPQNAALRRADTASNGLFGYEGHYCSVDRQQDPTALACGFFQSGVRVFDVRNPLKVREVAYYNPPAQSARRALLQGSEHAALLSATSLAPPASDAANFNLGNPLGSVPAVPQPGAGLATAVGAVKADLSTDWCASPPRFVAPDQLWVTCQDSGVQILRFTNQAFPF